MTTPAEGRDGAFGPIPKAAVAAIAVAALILAAIVGGGIYYFNRGPSTDDVAATKGCGRRTGARSYSS